MEGFSTLRSTKRTVSLPSPHPIGLQCHCSAPPGSLPLGPRRALASRQICTLPGSPPLGPTGSLPYRNPHCSGPAASLLHQDSHLSSWSPAPHKTAISLPCWDPHPSGYTGPQLYRPARKPLHQAPTQATTGRLQTCLRDTDRTRC
jgi:hypothetical protein